MFTRKIRWLLVLLCIALFASSCVNNAGNEGTTTAAGTTTEAATEAETAFSLESLRIAGNDISKYTIVYRRNSYYKVLNKLEDLIVNDYDFDRLSAERLSDVIFAKFGVRLAVKQDTKFDETEYEILVGETDRDLHPTDLTEDQYVFKMEGKKLVMCGGSYGSTWHAADYFEKWIADQEAAKNANPDFTVASNSVSTYDIKVIACIGDSITYGSTSTDPAYLSYPANLQRMLWKDYVVFNYGRGGKTMRDDLADSYMATDEYKNCLANAIGYDLVLIMLGTNDSSRDPAWTSSDNTKFKRSCKTLIDSIKEKNENASFVLMNCPAYYGGGNAGSLAVRDVQKEIAAELYADGYDLTFYDMHSFTSQEMGAAMFPDQLHPADAGYVKMAEGVRDLVLAAINNGENKYFVSLEGLAGEGGDTEEPPAGGSGSGTATSALTFQFKNQSNNKLIYENPNAESAQAGEWETVIDVKFDDSVNIPDQRMMIYIDMADGTQYVIALQRRFENHRARIQFRADGKDVYHTYNNEKTAATMNEGTSGSKDMWCNGLASANATALMSATSFRLTVKYTEADGLVLTLADLEKPNEILFTLTDAIDAQKGAAAVTGADKDVLKNITVMPDTSCDNGSTKHNDWEIALTWKADGVEDTSLYDAANWTRNEGWTIVTEEE